MDSILTEESINEVLQSISVLKIILDRCVKAGGVFTSIDESTATNAHLSRINNFASKLKDQKEKEKK